MSKKKPRNQKMKKPRTKLTQEQKQKLQVYGLAIFTIVFMSLFIWLLITLDNTTASSLSSQLML